MFEPVVRPFQTPSAHGRAIIAATPKGTRENATLTWGGKATAPPVKARNNQIDVDCRATHGTQLALPPEPPLPPDMTQPYAKPDPADADYAWRVEPVNRNSQGWVVLRSVQPGTESSPSPVYGTPLMYRRTESMVLDSNHKDECAGDWEQMSGVASAVSAAFADLAADLKAGRGDNKEKCRTTLTWSNGNRNFLWNDDTNPNPFPDG